jgi:predicted ferric reductase
VAAVTEVASALPLTEQAAAAGAIAWHVARSAGIIAWALLTLSVVVGLAQSTRAVRGRPGPAWLRAFHANAGGLALVLVAVHVAGLLLDRTVEFDLVDVLVPFASGWRPAAVAWGVLAMHLLIAVGATAWLRARLPRGMWLKVHRGAAIAYALATAHLLTAGTDAGSGGLAAAAGLSVVVVGGLGLARAWLASPWAATRVSRAAAPRGRARTGSAPR